MISKRYYFLIGILVVGILVLFSDFLFLLFGGEYLARQTIPPLPTNSIVDDYCFSQHTYLCKNITYTTDTSPQAVLGQWSTPIYKSENSDGAIVYQTMACNESWLGLHYAHFHKRPGLACASIAAWVEEASDNTQVFIQLYWSVCPYIVDEYLGQPMNWYFRCNEG